MNSARPNFQAHAVQRDDSGKFLAHSLHLQEIRHMGQYSGHLGFVEGFLGACRRHSYLSGVFTTREGCAGVFTPAQKTRLGVELFVILLVDELERDVDVWGLELLFLGKLKSGIYDSLTLTFGVLEDCDG